MFPQAKVRHLQAAYLNHDLILLSTHETDLVARRKKFPKRFEEKWSTHLECENIILEAWCSMSYSGSPMYKLFNKIRQCCMSLVVWSRTLGNSKSMLEEKYKELENLTTMNNPDKLVQTQKVRDVITSTLFQDELFWRQHYRSIWLPAGDKNTRSFHQRASQRRRKNHIVGFEDEEGRWCTSDEDKERVAKTYFQKLFSTTNQNIMGPILDSMDIVVTPDMNETLLQPYTPDEVKQALF